MTVMLLLAELLAALVSTTPAAPTEAKKFSMPALVGWIEIWKFADAPFFNVPRLKIKLLLTTVKLGFVGETPFKITPGGSVLVSITPGASFGPALVTLTP